MINIRTPHDYQRVAIDALHANMQHNPILTLPTGGGKTLCGATFIRESKRRTLWLAERQELVQQGAHELRQHGLDVGVIMAGCHRHPNRPIQVASVQTLVRRDFPDVEQICVDEVHHAPGRRLHDLLLKHDHIPRFGLTATPFRLDGKPLSMFGKLLIGAYPEDLVARGILVEPRVYAPARDPNELKGVKVVGGDYEKGKLGKAMSKPKLIGDCVETWKKHAFGLKTVMFACSVEHSHKLIDAFIAAGIPAEHIDANTEKGVRGAAIKRLENGETKILSNVGLVCEGWDLPSLQCAIIARPTASLCLHIQQVGRCMRAAAGKTSSTCVVLDHAGNFLRHGRVTRRLEYSLTEAVKPVDEDLGLIVCEKCQRMVSSKRKVCPECGAALPVPEQSPGLGSKREIPKHYSGELVSFDDAMAELEKLDQDKFYREMLRVAEEKGYAVGWAAWRYRDKFGTWPEGSAELAKQRGLVTV